MKIIFLTACILINFNCFSADKCNKAEAKKKVIWACDLIKTKGDKAFAEIKKMRFCKTNYVWVQESVGNLKMVFHPIKPKLKGYELIKMKDKNGKFFIKEAFADKKVKTEGVWVEYIWPVPGAEGSSATPKISFFKMCGDKKNLATGAGVWK